MTSEEHAEVTDNDEEIEHREPITLISIIEERAKDSPAFAIATAVKWLEIALKEALGQKTDDNWRQDILVLNPALELKAQGRISDETLRSIASIQYAYDTMRSTLMNIGVNSAIHFGEVTLRAMAAVQNGL